MELINQSKDSQPLVPKEKAPMAKAEDFRLLPNGGGPLVNGDQPKVSNGSSSTDIPLIDNPDTNDNKFNMADQNKTDDVSIAMQDSTDALDGYNDNIPDEHSDHSTDSLSLRFNKPDVVDGVVHDHSDAPDAEDDKKSDFNNVKHLTQGMMDVALLSANANQLRIVLESSHSHPYYVSSIVLISASLICQVAVGISLIMDYQYHMTDQPQKARTASRFSMLGIFLIIIINVFIAAFSVASPVIYRSPELTTTT